MSSISERLKEERKRLRLNQDDFGGIAGVSKRTVIDWEKGITSPTTVQLSELSEQGFDALYVLTGQRKTVMYEQAANQPLTTRETCMLENYRALAEEDQAAVQRMTSALAQSVKPNGESA